MKVSDIYTQTEPVISLEFFPPKENMELVFETLKNLIEFGPNFVSVTSKSDGTNKDKTFEITSRIKIEYGIEAIPHLTCISTTMNEINENLSEINEKGLENILALRGDRPEELVNSHFRHASQLVLQIKQNMPDFCIGVAGYPETHPEAESIENDLDRLTEKIDNGADFVITQMFFENGFFFDFLEKSEKIGIEVPVVAGIMPIFSYKNINKFAKMCGVQVPCTLERKMRQYIDDPDSIIQLGIDFALEQCSELLDNKIPGLHFYTMNRSTQVGEILRQLQK